MKGVVPDLVAGTHRVKSLPCRLERSAMQLAVCDAGAVPGVSIRPFRRQVRGKLLSNRLCNRRFVVRKARQPRIQRASARRTQFATNGVIVVQVERA